MMDHIFTITINEKELKFAKKVKLIDLIDGDVHDYIAALVNNKLRELNYEVFYDAKVELLTQKDYDAIRIYETSLRYIVAMACSRVFPRATTKYSYSISRSIFLTFTKDAPCLDSKSLKLLDNEIKNIINQDYPLIRTVVPNEEAKEIYLKKGFDDKIEILKYRPEKTVHLYSCAEYMNYMYGHMVPSTGHIKDYSLRIYDNGIIIQYPRSEEKGKIPEFQDAPTFGRVLKESYEWGKLVRTSTVSQIHDWASKENQMDFITMCEAHHNNMLAELGIKILSDISNIRMICIAGPSSSGKTTFANRLRVELMSRGLSPIRISIDDYYLEKKYIPKDENGQPDLECIEALNIDQFNQDMLDLINGEEVTLPHFDFKIGKQVPGKTLKLGKNEILIIEGIHALNDRLTSLVARHQKYKIFIAPQAQVNIDNHNPISLTDLRLLRRIVRDYKFRGSSAEETMSMWASVRKGEFKWIYSTQEDADYVFNSLLPYELCVMRRYALPLLRAIDKESDYGPLAERLIKFLKFFIDMDDKWVPCNSIIRKFIGDSCFQDV